MSALLTVVLVLTRLVKALAFTCGGQDLTAGIGNVVTMQASCYPNGTVSYSWNSRSPMWHLQIEYQCYKNGTTHEQTPNPATQQPWSDRNSGDGTLTVQPWEEGTSCIFSGCYDNSREKGYPTYVIPDATCTIMTSIAAHIESSSVVTSSPALPTLLLPTTTYFTPSPSPSHTPELPISLPPVHMIPHLTPSPSPSHTPALPTPLPPVHMIPHLTPSPFPSHTPALPTPLPPVHMMPHLTPSLTTRSLPHTSPTIQPKTLNTGLLAGVTVAVAAVMITLLGLVAVLGVIAIYKNGQHKHPRLICNELLDSSYSPVSPHHQQLTFESSETLLNPLEIPPHLQVCLVSYENSPYVVHSPRYINTVETTSFLNALNQLSDLPDNHSDITESADGGSDIADSMSVGTQRAVEEKEEEEEEEEVGEEGDEEEEKEEKEEETEEKEEEKEEEEKNEEEKDKKEEEEMEEEEVVEKEGEKGGREQMCFELSGHAACSKEKSGTFESPEHVEQNLDHQQDVDELFELDLKEPSSINDSSYDGSFYIGGGTYTASSGYITAPNTM